MYKLTRFEFWPWWMFYLPMLPVYLIGVIYSRRWLYFTAVNPSIEMGGFFGERKSDILELLPNDRITKSILIKSNDDAVKELESSDISFPIIAKPNVGERGFQVKLLNSSSELASYATRVDEFLIQEYCVYPIELGVLFVKLPGQPTQVTSIAEKEFLSVTGDGVNDVGFLIEKHARNRMYTSILKNEYPEKTSIIPALGEEFIVHKIGNHVKGTRFVNKCEMNTDLFSNEIAKIADALDGVRFGRLDMKISSYQDVERGEGVKIFEMNGVSAEPGHIYDLPNYFMALYQIARHWWMIILMSKDNIKKGVKTTPIPAFLKQVTNHFS